MKLLFLVLLAANLGLYAWQSGVFGRMPEVGREPDRVNRQVEPERIRVLTQAELERIREKIKDLPSVNITPAVASCVEFGDFDAETLQRVQLRLSEFALGDRLTARAVEMPGGYLVYVSPLRSRADAEKRADELRKRGIKEASVIVDNSPRRHGLALGIFREQERARQHRADLEKRGVRDLRVTDSPVSEQGTRLQIANVDASLAQQLELMRKEFAPGRLKPCS